MGNESAKKYKETLGIVTKIINDWNPANLLPDAPDDEYEFEIARIVVLLNKADSVDEQRLLEQYESIVEMLDNIEKSILALLGEIPMAEHLRSIKGLGTIFTAAILAGAGDLKLYAHGRQLLRKAGLNLAESTSGKRKGQIILSKRGDAILRKYMYLATTQLVANNPSFKQWHEHNVQNKHMKKQRSILKLVGKLARVLIGIVHHGESFSPDKAAPIYDKAA